LFNPFGGVRKRVFPVMIEAEDERSIHLNPAIVQHTDAPRIVRGSRRLLARIGKIVIAKGLKANEYSSAASKCHIADELRIVSDVDGHRSAPYFVQRLQRATECM